MQVIRLAVFACGMLFLAGVVHAQPLDKISDTVGAVTQENPAVENSAQKEEEAFPNEASQPAEEPVHNQDAATAIPADPNAANAPALNAPKDPCEAYMSNISAYNVCHDRLNKIDRMKKAKERREGKSEEPAKAAPVTEDTAAPKDTAPVESKPAASETTGESPKK